MNKLEQLEIQFALLYYMLVLSLIIMRKQGRISYSIRAELLNVQEIRINFLHLVPLLILNYLLLENPPGL